MNEEQELERQALEELDKQVLIDLIMTLQTQLAEQRQAIQALRDQIAKNSQNSSKPPGSDGLKKPKTKSLRLKSERPYGGQPGHAGATLKMVAEPDEMESHCVTNCPHCQENLSAVAVIGYEKRQVFDIPPLPLMMTEHQAEIKQCPGCGATVQGEFPQTVTQVTQYGPRIKAQASYLNTYHFIPLARTEELLNDFYGQGPSETAVLNANQHLAKLTQRSLSAIQTQLISSDVVHFDESGLRIANRLQWLHVSSTETLTFYPVDAKRGSVGRRAAGILPEFCGTALHDRWAAYLAFENCHHAFCNAHHLRELQFIVDQYQQPWASDMAQLLRTIKAEVDGSPQTCSSLPPERLLYFNVEYDKLIAQGLAANPSFANPPPSQRGRPKQSPPKNLLDRLQSHKAGLLAFMADFRIPFDNNQAERDVRMVKVKQKVSGAFRTKTGAETFCAIRSYISTARKQGLNAIDALFNAFLGLPFIPTANTSW